MSIFNILQSFVDLFTFNTLNFFFSDNFHLRIEFQMNETRREVKKPLKVLSHWREKSENVRKRRVPVKI